MPEAPAQQDEPLSKLRAFLSERKLSLNSRLPAERALSEALGMPRGKLRRALAVLEAEGLIWRHVGRGTFIGPRPILNLSDVAFLSDQTSPSQMMEARLAIEPQLAQLAALHGTASDLAEMRRCARRCRAAEEWRVYEAWDHNFHQAVAAATKNKLLISLFETLNSVRRGTVWGQFRPTKVPPPDHRSFDEHDAILDAITARAPEQAAEAMRRHLGTVRNRIVASLGL